MYESLHSSKVYKKKVEMLALDTSVKSVNGNYSIHLYN